MIQLAKQDFFRRFNCEFNAIDEAKLRKLTSCDFIRRGENLLILGESGSGKSDITKQIEEEAGSLGLRCHFLTASFSPFADTHFIETSPNEVAEDKAPQFFPALLEADVLIVDEAQRWLEVAPHEFTFLLCQRISVGKSNILLIPSHGWKNALENAVNQRRLPDSPVITKLAGMTSGIKALWPRTILHGYMTFEEQIQVLGIGLTSWNDPCKQAVFDLLSVPKTPEAKALQSEFDVGLFAWCNQSLSEWMHGPGWKPVWHVLYTGNKNYRRNR